jgi:hypothetical protein
MINNKIEICLINFSASIALLSTSTPGFAQCSASSCAPIHLDHEPAPDEMLAAYYSGLSRYIRRKFELTGIKDTGNLLCRVYFDDIGRVKKLTVLTMTPANDSNRAIEVIEKLVFRNPPQNKMGQLMKDRGVLLVVESVPDNLPMIRIRLAPLQDEIFNLAPAHQD